MQIWNQAQEWFAKEYFPNSSVYTFDGGNSSAPVQVRLLNQSTLVGTFQGWTDYREQNSVMVSANVTIAAWNSKQAVLILSLHELGHVLGLGHVSCCERDLMDPYPLTNSASSVPSTLDLYAVHILASGDQVPIHVLLPKNIPYQAMPNMELAMPEFENQLEVSIIVPCLIIHDVNWVESHE